MDRTNTIKEQIELFYRAFNDLDAEKMVAQYHEDIIFEDPAFGVLQGDRAKNMWRMLCASQQGRTFKIQVSQIVHDNHTASAVWKAHYIFSKTGREIHNTIQAQFEFKDGKIISHKDTFDLYRWSRQALGIKGLLLGWTSFFARKLQNQTNKLLSRYENNRSQ
ncbi:nuclear transport factor 2 family protein [Sediminicola sp. 1XM1-17]|uniref:nuclear transport factor 2 family protein n=1 Tax=Sediminicola sp. 1XM1-17 TaxID=3127702 RepID=UPI00307830D9